jgi:hypothetical protein
MEYTTPDGSHKVIISNDVAANDAGVVLTLTIYKRRTDGNRGYELLLMLPLRP